MILADLDRVLAGVVRRAVTGAALPASAAGYSAAANWRRPSGGQPGSYASTLPFRLAQRTGLDPRGAAALLAAGLAGTGWVAAAEPTGTGYLTITVTTDALAALAARMVGAGPDCLRGDALSGQMLTIPPPAGLASAATWPEAWRRANAAATGRIAGAAGAIVTVRTQAERIPPTASPAPRPGPVAAAVAFAGAGPVRYALTRRQAGRPAEIDAAECVRQEMRNPYFAVSYARASAVRRAGGPGEVSGAAGGEPPGPGPASPGRHQLAALDAISWLPERLAQASRKRQPHRLAAGLEELAGAWLDCAEACLAGRSAARSAATPAARLAVSPAAPRWLAAATAVALGAGLDALGVGAAELP